MRRRHIDFRPLRSLRERDRHSHIEPISYAAKKWMGTYMNRQQDIARRRITHPWHTLAAQPNLFAVIDTGRNFHSNRFHVARLVAAHSAPLRRRVPQ